MITLPNLMPNKILNKDNLIHNLKLTAPGLALVAGVAALAKFLAMWLPNLGEASVAILCGMIISNGRDISARFQPGLAYAEKHLLAYSVVLLGFGLTWDKIQELGWRSFLIIIFIVAMTVLNSVFLGRLLGLSKSLSLLLGMGNAICGSSAVAAAAPLLTRDGKEIGLAISVVNLLGTLGLFILPGLVHALSYDDQAASLLVGGSLQAVGHVVAAGFAINPQVGELSLAIKMSRIFLLAPALLLLAFIVNKNADSAQMVGGKKVGEQKMPLIGNLPGYLYGFIACAAAANSGLLAPRLVSGLVHSSHFLLLLAMTGIGLRIKIRTLLRHGPKAFLLGSLTFGLQILVLVLISLWR